MGKDEFHQHAKETGIYYMPESLDSDFFQRFLRKHTEIRTTLMHFLEISGIVHTSIELRQNAENHMDIIVVVCNRTRQRMIDGTTLDSQLL